ncbi:MAG: patatin-like phospholipase family protein [Gaiellales bacterium]
MTTDGHNGKTAFVFAGGASLASIQAGTLRALLEAGIRPDIVVGTSSGALNAALFAANPEPAAAEAMTRAWRSHRRRDLFPIRPGTLVRGLTGRGGHLVPNTGLRRVISADLPIRRLEDAALPLHVVAADARSGEPVELSSGDAVEALVACCALPGLYPPVRVNGRLLVDGGLAEDPPLGTAVRNGADRAYVLPVGWPPVERPYPRRAWFRGLYALDHLYWRVALAELERWCEECEVYVLPSPPISDLSPVGFRASERLMDEAYRMGRTWLEAPRPWRSGDHRPRNAASNV